MPKSDPMFQRRVPIGETPCRLFGVAEEGLGETTFLRIDFVAFAAPKPKGLQSRAQGFNPGLTPGFNPGKSPHLNTP
jgi:hypothetical protein